MDDQLLQELYGVGSEEEHYSQDDDLIKQAQAELIEAVADEAGIDLNEMDDEELAKFASYVLSPEAADHEDDYVESADPYAEADQMGRIMAHAYADEQMKIASALEYESNYDNALVKVAHGWDMLKLAAEDTKLVDRTPRQLGKSIAERASRMTGYRDIKKGLELTRSAKDYMRGLTPEQLKDLNFRAESSYFRDLSPAKQREFLINRIQGIDTSPGRTGAYLDRKAGRKLLMRGAGKAGATLAGATALGYGAKRLYDRK